MSRRLPRLVIFAVALCQVSLPSEALGGAGVQIDGRALITRKIRPGDGSERDKAFARVREAILDAARRNDLETVVRYFAPRIRCDTEVITAEACAAQLRAAPDEAGDFLADLQRALEFGTAFDQDRIVAPYVAVAGDILMSLPEVRGQYFIVAADRVMTRSAPSTRAPAVDVLSYDIVATNDVNTNPTRGTKDDPCEAWVQIVRPSRREAWMCAKYLASPFDMRFVFQRQPDGEWKLTGAYVAH